MPLIRKDAPPKQTLDELTDENRRMQLELENARLRAELGGTSASPADTPHHKRPFETDAQRLLRTDPKRYWRGVIRACQQSKLSYELRQARESARRVNEQRGRT